MDLTIVGISLQTSHSSSVLLSRSINWVRAVCLQELTSRPPSSILPCAQTPEKHLERFFVLRLVWRQTALRL
jgi:hypothetical protein